jgi:hypothetical protein
MWICGPLTFGNRTNVWQGGIYQYVRQQESELELEDEVDLVMSSDIVAAQARLRTKKIHFANFARKSREISMIAEIISTLSRKKMFFFIDEQILSESRHQSINIYYKHESVQMQCDGDRALCYRQGHIYP